MKLTTRATNAIGLDISDKSIKLVQLSKLRDQIQVQALGKAQLPAGIIVEGEIKNQAVLSSSIQKLIASPQFGFTNTNEVFSVLPETKTFIKLITVDQSPNQLSSIMANEIEKHVPFQKNEIYFDWQIMESHNDYYKILIGAAHRDIVNQYTELFKKSKLSLLGLEIEPIAIARCLLKEESPKYNEKKDKNYAILDIGANRTSMLIYSRNTIVLSISLPISGHAITDKIAKTLEIKTEQAEKAKIICGFDNKIAQGIVADILSDTINQLLKKIEIAMDYFEIHYPEHGSLNKLILCGGGSNIRGIDRIIGEKLNIQTELGDPFTHISRPDKKLMNVLSESHKLSLDSAKDPSGKQLSAEQSSSLSFTTAFGLSLRPILSKN